MAAPDARAHLNVDEQCYLLAQHFLADNPMGWATPPTVNQHWSLATAIQSAIEDWLNGADDEIQRDRAEREFAQP